jgi:hypothetical protein
VSAAIGAAPDEEEEMRFMVSLISDGTAMQQASPEERKEMGMKMMEVMGELQKAGALADPGSALGPSDEAKTLRYGAEGQVVVTDGPFAETKEQLAGYMVLECADLDEAVGWAQKLPFAPGASVEVRPLAQRPG